MIYLIDLFCGRGGVSTGAKMATYNSKKIVKVIACVNHDACAIENHKANHPNTKHFPEDIKMVELKPIVEEVRQIRRNDPFAVIILWASLECTNFSNAKGGMPRLADSRTLAEHLDRYIIALDPDGIQVENVNEFKAWGPLDKNGKPVSREKGRDYLKWVETINSFGYQYENRTLNAANYGAYTSRKRYFGQFWKPQYSIAWPKPTHSKNPVNDIFGYELKPYKSVSDVLDLDDKGNSIFERKKPLAENTLRRIYNGLKKYVNPYNSVFLKKYHGNGNNTLSVNSVSSCLTTKDRLAKVTCQFIEKTYTGPYNYQSILSPLGTITTNPKFQLVSSEFFTFDNQFSGNPRSLDRPAQTLIARMDKKPPYLVCATSSKLVTKLNKANFYPEDSQYTRLIKEFMQKHGIYDIKMRMLKISELLKIQGFPDDEILIGTQTQIKKQIGNSVVPRQAQVLFEAFYEKNCVFESQQAV